MRFLRTLFGSRSSRDRSNLSIDERLMEAVSARKVDEVKDLLGRGANVNAHRTFSRQRGGALHPCKQPVVHAVFSWYMSKDDEQAAAQILRLLGDAGADMDARDESSDDWTLLMHAAFSNCSYIVEQLIEMGADTSLTANGSTAFELVRSKDDVAFRELVELLAERTQDGQAWRDSDAGKRWRIAWEESIAIDDSAPLAVPNERITEALQQCFREERDRIDDLHKVINWVKAGGDLDWREPGWGWTLLHLAAQAGNEQMVSLLIANGADVEARGKRDDTPLSLACNNLYMAWRSLNPSVVKMLLENGADPNCEDCDGSTPLGLLRRVSVSEETRAVISMLESHDAERMVGVTKECPECGAPESRAMRKRHVHVTIKGTFASFPCGKCAEEVRVLQDDIDKERGALVRCPSCDGTTLVPSDAWCGTCGIGFSTRWHSLIRSE